MLLAYAAPLPRIRAWVVLLAPLPQLMALATLDLVELPCRHRRLLDVRYWRGLPQRREMLSVLLRPPECEAAKRRCAEQNKVKGAETRGHSITLQHREIICHGVVSR